MLTSKKLELNTYSSLLSLSRKKLMMKKKRKTKIVSLALPVTTPTTLAPMSQMKKTRRKKKVQSKKLKKMALICSKDLKPKKHSTMQRMTTYLPKSSINRTLVKRCKTRKNELKRMRLLKFSKS